MITDFSNGRFDQIKAYANTYGLQESLQKAFTRLEHYSQNGCDVHLCSDFAPLSLYFEITRDGQFVLHGGVIFHGHYDGYGGSP